MYTKGSGFLRAKQAPKHPEPSGTPRIQRGTGAVMSKRTIAGVIILVLFVFFCCAGIGVGGWWWTDGDDGNVAVEPAAPGDSRLVQDCPLPPGASLTWFDDQGVLHWTSDAMSSDDGSMTVRYCDGDVARSVRVTGLWAGSAENWQEGAMVDRARRVVRRDDLITLVADRPVPSPRLEGVTLQCVPLMGSCRPNDTEGIVVALAAETSANPVGGGSTP